MTERFAPGGDAQIIAYIAKLVYGGYQEMFEAYDWPLPKDHSKLMLQAPTYVVRDFGSIKAFAEAHDV